VKTAAHIDVREGWRAESLIPDADGGCAGVLARDSRGFLHRIEASDTVLATGSLGGLYAVTTTPWTSQGQALAMAAALGAEIRDAEFVQFHPTAIDIGRDPAPLATEALRGEGAVLVDAAGARFMKAVHQHAELAPRDVVARAVHRQVKSGKGAFLDCTQAVGANFPERFPAVFAACMSAGIDPRVTPIPVAPAAHYHMGGVNTDLDGFTGVPGLWAVGECAATGVHGANRLASNSLLDGLVFGRRAAQALQTAMPRVSRSLDAQTPPALPGPALQRLRQVMAAEAGVERDGAGLLRLIAVIDHLEARYGAAPALVAARFVAAGAVARVESRGGHFRSDHPQTGPVGVPTRMRLEDAYASSAPVRQAAEMAE
jgi:L-aspartate oxidase